MDAEEKKEIAAMFRRHVEVLVVRIEQRIDAATADVKAYVDILRGEGK